MRSRVAIVAGLLIGVIAAVPTVLAIDVRVSSEKGFDPLAARTWGWHPQGPGDVRMARAGESDPEVMRMLAEPTIIEAVAAEMERRGRQHAADRPDLLIRYYLLVTAGAGTLDIGQAAPDIPAWRLPLFRPAMESNSHIAPGSLVLDISTPHLLVWRGVAQAGITPDVDRARRDKFLREAVRDLLRQLPLPR